MEDIVFCSEVICFLIILIWRVVGGCVLGMVGGRVCGLGGIWEWEGIGKGSIGFIWGELFS